MRYTPQGTAVTTFGMATNRSWKTDAGEQRDEAEFHRIVAWNKLAELCSQLLAKGRRVYVEGRLQTRTFTGQDGQQRSVTEIVLEDMIVLDPPGLRRTEGQASHEQPAEEAATSEAPTATPVSAPAQSSPADDSKPSDGAQDKATKKKKASAESAEPALSENVDASDIPF